MATEPAGYDDTIPTPTEPDEDADQYRQPGGDHAADQLIHSLGAVNESGEALRADGAVAPQKDESKWRGE